MNYLAIQNNYDEVQLSLINGPSRHITHSISKMHASTKLIPTIDALLKEHGITLSDLSFIVANNGPGPFTTLRVVITTINGIAYAAGIPLIGVNALYAAAQEWKSPDYPITAILFNAFGNDLYTLLMHHDETLLYGVYSVDAVIEQLALIGKPIRLLGNGAALHQAMFEKKLGKNALIPENVPAYCSLTTIAHIGLEQWNTQKSGEGELMPVYLKQHPAQT